MKISTSNSPLERALSLFIVFSAMSFAGRCIEMFSLASNYFISTEAFLYQTIGFGNDIIFVSAIVLLYFIIGSIIPRASKGIGHGFFILFIIITAVHSGLSSYFILLLYPVDRVIFSFTYPEIVQFITASSRNPLTEAMPFIISAATGICCYVFIGCLGKKKLISIALASLAGISAVFCGLNIHNDQPNSRVYSYMAQNKFYLLAKYNNDSQEFFSLDQYDHDTEVKRYWDSHPEHEFVNKEYPLLHREKYENDVLGHYFDTMPAKPNIVIIAVESLGRSFCGPDAKNGSLTPFLDSLIGHSLFWSDYYAASERTFEVFSSSLASLPYGRDGFNRLPMTPDHHSMVSLVRHNGYRSSFLFASDFKIYGDNWWRFFSGQGVDTILDVSNFPSIPDFTDKNGQPDEILFQHANNIFGHKNTKPQLTVMLTCSMHEPSHIPDQEKYMAQLRSYLQQNKQLTDDQRAVIKGDMAYSSSVFYTDSQLRNYFEGQKRSGVYDNTIYVIFGDHSRYKFDPHSQLQQYRVPLIIHSPMLKKSARFDATSSSLDLTPTLLCMLKNKCGLDLPRYTHWIGSRLDTASAATCTKHLPFITVSRGTSDYLRGEQYLNGKLLYRRDGDALVRVHDTTQQASIVQDIETYNYINKYVCTRNKLLPDSLLFNGVSQMLISQMKGAQFKDYEPHQEYYTLFNGVFSSKEFYDFSARMTFEMNSELSKPYDMARLVVAASDRVNKKDLCYQVQIYSPSDWSDIRSNTWQPISLKQNANMLRNSADSISVSIYLWNPHKASMQYRNVSFELYGIKP